MKLQLNMLYRLAMQINPNDIWHLASNLAVSSNLPRQWDSSQLSSMNNFKRMNPNSHHIFHLPQCSWKRRISFLEESQNLPWSYIMSGGPGFKSISLYWRQGILRWVEKISFGGISSKILMPCLTTWAPFFCAMVLPMWTMLSPKGVQNNHMAAPDKVAKQQATP